MKLVVYLYVVCLYEVIEMLIEICMVMEYVEFGDLFDYIVFNGWFFEDEFCYFF